MELVQTPQWRQEWFSVSPFQLSARSISPSVGHLKGSAGSIQYAGQMPGADGGRHVAVR
jgi:hypothetical protein